MPSLSIARSANASFTPSYVPVIVITGATSGIGKALAKTFAQHIHYNGRAHIILVGRNVLAANAILASLPSNTAQESTYEFIPCDLTLMKNAHHLAEEISHRAGGKINFLVHCAGVFGLRGRKETEEGVDVKLATRYYSRWALTHDLVPLLQKARDEGEAAGVLSVLAAGQAPAVDLDDLGLMNTYSGVRAMGQSICYNDLMVAEFAERNPDIAFTHIYPGVVDTGMFTSSNLFSKIVLFILRPLIWLTTTTPETCAEYMLFALLDAEKGMYRRNSRGDDIGMKGFPMAKDAQKIVWEHSLKVTTVS